MHSGDSLTGVLRIVGMVVLMIVINRRKDSSASETDRRQSEHRVDTRAIARAVSEWQNPSASETDRRQSEHRVDTRAIARAVSEWQTPTPSRRLNVPVRPESQRSDPMWDRELDG
jgi:hypothetical protein